MHGKQADSLTGLQFQLKKDIQDPTSTLNLISKLGVSESKLLSYAESVAKCEASVVQFWYLPMYRIKHWHTHTQSFHMGIWSGWWEFSDKERDKQINGSLSSLEFEKVVQGFSDWLHWSLWCLKASKLQCYQGHESHQHQFSSCTEKGDSDCTKKQEGNWIAQHHHWHSVNLSVLLGYRQWKSGMCESYDWRFVDHPSWSKHGHTIAPKWGRMKNPGLGKKTEPSRTHFALL